MAEREKVFPDRLNKPGMRVTDPQPDATDFPAQAVSSIVKVFPGLLLSAVVAIAAAAIALSIAPLFPIPGMVVALLIGIALNPLARRHLFQPGTSFCLKTVLPIAVALLGLRIALGDIVALGITTAVLVMLSMAATIVAGLLFARLLGQTSAYGALAGVATAVCGASAALATAIVLPDYKNKAADVAFVAIAVNALSTVAMMLYPVICAALGFDERSSGTMIGATIHDVAQVVGAGYAISEPTGNTAVIVKLFRVFLLLPVVLGVGWYFTRSNVKSITGKIHIPLFAVGFLILCVVNSLAPSFGAAAPVFAQIKSMCIEASTWGLLIAISALGLRTSFAGIAALGWRHVATVTGTTVVILAVATAGLLILR